MAPPRRQRDLSNSSQIRSLAQLFADTEPSPHLRPRLNEISDGRLWHPDGRARPSLSLPGTPKVRLQLENARPVRRKVSGRIYRFNNQTKAVLAFADPENTITCIRRKIRRQVMFAHGGVGRRRRPRKMRWWSTVRC